MALSRPKEVKYQKNKKGKIKGIEYSSSKINFGSFALKALEPGRITARQIEAVRQAIYRKIKRRGKVWVCIFPNNPVSAKPKEVRMGKGKGAVSFWACSVKPGKILYEVNTLSPKLAKQALESGAAKLPILTKFVKI
jgi:large subunit ribosomal protein L16